MEERRDTAERAQPHDSYFLPQPKQLQQPCPLRSDRAFSRIASRCRLPFFMCLYTFLQFFCARVRFFLRFFFFRGGPPVDDGAEVVEADCAAPGGPPPPASPPSFFSSVLVSPPEPKQQSAH